MCKLGNIFYEIMVHFSFHVPRARPMAPHFSFDNGIAGVQKGLKANGGRQRARSEEGLMIAVIGCNGQLGGVGQTGLGSLPAGSGTRHSGNRHHRTGETGRLLQFLPTIFVHAAAYTAADRAESEEEATFAVNCDGPAHLADRCFGHGFEEALAETVDWYLNNLEWVESVRSGGYRACIEPNYGKR
jgi:hypothetical protein